MNLSAEEKQIGKSNFTAVTNSDITRREFLAGSIAAVGVGGVGLGAYYFGYSKVNDPVRVGFIGTGDEGNVLINNITPEYISVIAISDIRPYNIFRTFHGDQSSPSAAANRCGLMKKYGWKS